MHTRGIRPSLFGEELTGPEYSGRFIEMVNEAGIEYLTGAMALACPADREVTFVSSETGYVMAQASAVVLAMACRERTRGAIGIPGTRPQGVFTAGTAQRQSQHGGDTSRQTRCNFGFKRHRPYNGAQNDARRRQSTVRVEIMPHSSGLARNIAQRLDDFGIPALPFAYRD